MQFEGIIVGGSALILLGIIQRQTQNLDLLNDSLALELVNDAMLFAKSHGLAQDWLNNAPAGLKKDLPKHWEIRLQKVFDGRTITLHALGRCDLIKTKLWALCDRTRDLPDVLALQPSALELKEACDWLKPLDLNPGWILHVENTIAFVSKKLDYTNECT